MFTESELREIRKSLLKYRFYLRMKLSKEKSSEYSKKFKVNSILLKKIDSFYYQGMKS